MCRRAPYRNNPLWLCISCDCFICETCWDQVRPAHDRQSERFRGIDHEKINPKLQERLDFVFHPEHDDDELRELHQAEEANTWFGKVQSSHQMEIILTSSQALAGRGTKLQAI